MVVDPAAHAVHLSPSLYLLTGHRQPAPGAQHCVAPNGASALVILPVAPLVHGGLPALEK